MGLFGKDEKKVDVIGTCPACESVETAVVCQNYEWHLDGERVLLMPTGYRLSCQRCPCIFSVNRHGAFQHHAQSLPWIPSPRVLDAALPEPPQVPEPPKLRPRPPNASNDPLPFRHPKQR